MTKAGLDPRTGGACLQCMAKKIFSFVVGYLQLVSSVFGFLILLFSPSTVTSVVDTSTTEMVLSGFLQLLCIMFIAMLLVGLHKNRPMFIQVYCIFMCVYTVLMMMSLVIYLFVRPGHLGVLGFFLSLLGLFIYMVFIFVVRCYYLVTYCNNFNQRNRNQPKV